LPTSDHDRHASLPDERLDILYCYANTLSMVVGFQMRS
jgi:hypothetical protein